MYIVYIESATVEGGSLEEKDTLPEAIAYAEAEIRCYSGGLRKGEPRPSALIYEGKLVKRMGG